MTQIILTIVLPVAVSGLLFKWAATADASRIRWIHPVFRARLISCILFSGCVFAFPLSDSEVNYLNLDFTGWPAGIVFTLIFSGLAIWVAYRISLQPSTLKVYPQVRMSLWPTSLVARNAITWIIYMFGYELFFRGFLLFSALELVPVAAAIGINLVVYSAAHFHKGWKEILMAIPFGFLLCVMTLHSGNVWSAFIIHTTLALSNDWFALKMQPAIDDQSKTMIRL